MRNVIFLAAFICLQACTTQYMLSSGEAQSQNIDDRIANDATVENLIQPYRRQIEAEMGTVIGTVEQEMQKRKPESTLGNWFCDAMLDYANAHQNSEFDFALNNYGGIRIPSLAKGDLTIGKIYELMPFDNALVILKADAATMRKLFQMLAEKDGWPISRNVQLKIKDKAIDALTINGNELEDDKTYTIVTSDYVAGGGDAAYFLKDLERIETGVLLRDALIAQAKAYSEAGKSINAQIENRISYTN